MQQKCKIRNNSVSNSKSVNGPRIQKAWLEPCFMLELNSLIWKMVICELRFSTNCRFPFRGGRGGPSENDHEFPFAGDVELLRRSLRATFSTKESMRRWPYFWESMRVHRTDKLWLTDWRFKWNGTKNFTKAKVIEGRLFMSSWTQADTKVDI